MGGSYSRPQNPTNPEGGAGAAPRTDCSAILGTAFRSPDERKWYDDNCNKWPLAKFDGPARSGPVAAGCAELQGKPYTSTDQRNWYQQNCTGGAIPAAPNPLDASNGGLPNTGAPPPPAQVAQIDAPADRHDCGAIRGTPYQSETERAWYTANCITVAPQPSVPATRPVQQVQQVQSQPTPGPNTPLSALPGAPAQAYQMQTGTLCGLPIGAVDPGLQALHRQVCGTH